ncbi:MAG: restriction endonuclease [Gemmatimonadales bacterium]|nr:restriction endonuclease [Gemmatimonadales bacterium]
MTNRIHRERVGFIMKAVLSELKAAGGRARLRDLFVAVEPRLDLSPHERATLEKSGYLRWRSLVHFYSIDLVKAGYLLKAGGQWELTPAGEAALELPDREFIRSAGEKYREWRRKTADKREEEVGESDTVSESETAVARRATYEQALEQSRVEITRHLDEMEPYDFQRLVAELLKAMGYHVPFVAPPGPDGGVDLVAYRDPLGTTSPRIKVQIKHRAEKVTVRDGRELEGLLRKEGDIGLIVSSGGFTREVEREIRNATRHIEIMDQERLISLWEEYYDRISQEGKALLPLVRISFLAPQDE